LEPFDWKQMALVEPSGREIRVHTAWEHRVLYVAKFAEAVYVLHAFEKRTRKTPQRDASLAQQRFRELLALRRARKVPGG
jgi:phage-related protein